MKELEFECSMDFPVLQLITNVKVLNNDGSRKNIRFFVFYDYVLDSFFMIHPYQINRGANSYLPVELYEKAFVKSDPRIEAAIYEHMHLARGSEIISVVYEDYYPYISSYKFICRLTDHFEFDFDTLDLKECNKKNIYALEENKERFDLKQSIVELYDAVLFGKALSYMAKMKYSYKSKNFKIEEDKYINLDTLDSNEKILLARDYFNNLNSESNLVVACSSNVKCDAEGKVILDLCKVDDYYENQLFILKDNNIVSYIPCILNSYIDIFDEYVDIPFTLETVLNDADKKNVASKMMVEMSSTGNVNVDVLTKLALMIN